VQPARSEAQPLPDHRIIVQASAPPVGRVAEGRQEQRHMVMGTLRHGEPDRDLVEKTAGEPVREEILADMEHELERPGLEDRFGQDRPVGPAVVVRDHLAALVAPAVLQTVEFDLHSSSGEAAGGIEDMGREVACHGRFLSSGSRSGKRETKGTASLPADPDRLRLPPVPKGVPMQTHGRQPPSMPRHDPRRRPSIVSIVKTVAFSAASRAGYHSISRPMKKSPLALIGNLSTSIAAGLNCPPEQPVRTITITRSAAARMFAPSLGHRLSGMLPQEARCCINLLWPRSVPAENLPPPGRRKERNLRMRAAKLLWRARRPARGTYSPARLRPGRRICPSRSPAHPSHGVFPLVGKTGLVGHPAGPISNHTRTNRYLEEPCDSHRFF